MSWKQQKNLKKWTNRARRLLHFCRYESLTHLFSPFWSPSLSVSILLRPSHHFVLLRLPCVICTFRLKSVLWCWEGGVQWRKNKHNLYFPSNALKLKWRVCFENVRRRKYRHLCPDVVKCSKSTDPWTYSNEGFVLLLPTAALSYYSVIQLPPVFTVSTLTPSILEKGGIKWQEKGEMMDANNPFSQTTGSS